MGIFNRRRDRDTDANADDRHRMDVECHHRTLLPRWDRVEDMGREELATNYQCSACNQFFSAEEARELREAAQRTLHETITS